MSGKSASARVSASRHDIEQAMLDFDQAIRIRRHFAEAYNKRGIVWLYRADLVSAEADFDSAIKSKPDLAEAHGNRGNVGLHSGNPRGAFLDFDKALGLYERPYVDSGKIAVRDPRLAKAFINRGAAPNRTLTAREPADVRRMKSDCDTAFLGLKRNGKSGSANSADFQVIEFCGVIANKKKNSEASDGLCF